MKLTLAALLVAAAAAQAQQFIIQRYPPKHPRVKTSATFSAPLAGNFLPSEQVYTLLCGFVNEADRPMNISGVFGTLNAPGDFTRYLHNFTAYPVGDVVSPGDEIAIEYKMFVPPVSEPTDVQLAVTVFFDDGHYHYGATFFNSTMSLRDSGSVAFLRPVNLASYALAAAAVLASIYFMRDLISPSARAAVQSVTGGAVVQQAEEEEEVANIRATSSPAGRAAKPRTSSGGARGKGLKASTTS